jgi:hypothetical protein
MSKYGTENIKRKEKELFIVIIKPQNSWNEINNV